MFIVSKYYESTKHTEHFMIVPEWKEAYAQWNRMQWQLRDEKGIEPLLVLDSDYWNSGRSKEGETVFMIAEYCGFSFSGGNR